MGIHIFLTQTKDIAAQGNDEISSCLFHYTQNMKNNSEDGDHLIIWSDSYAGQNKNFITQCLRLFLILTGRFKIIDYKVPDSDRDFGGIEIRSRNYQNILTLEHYNNIIKEASGI